MRSGEHFGTLNLCLGNTKELFSCLVWGGPSVHCGVTALYYGMGDAARQLHSTQWPHTILLYSTYMVATFNIVHGGHILHYYIVHLDESEE